MFYFKTLGILVVAMVVGQTSAQTPSPIFYVGCYNDYGGRTPSQGPRDLPIWFCQNGHNSPGIGCDVWAGQLVMTPPFCSELCKGYKFFAVANGKNGNCFCGNSYGKYGKAPESDCNMPCPGNSSWMCGGSYINRVYAQQASYITNNSTTNEKQ